MTLASRVALADNAPGMEMETRTLQPNMCPRTLETTWYPVETKKNG